MRPIDSLLLSVALAFSGAVVDAGANTFMVTRGDDPAPGACAIGDCSLREALAAAAATPGADRVELAAGLYQVARGTLTAFGDVEIRGVDAASTRIVGSGSFDLLVNGPLGVLAVTGAALDSGNGVAIGMGPGGLRLDDVAIALSGGGVEAYDELGAVTLRIDRSTVDYVTCGGPQALCEAFDSRVGVFLVQGHGARTRLERVDAVAVDTQPLGIAILSSGSVDIVDSTVRGYPDPLILGQLNGAADVDDVHIVRTRFIDNHGPLQGDRDSGVYLDDIEFRGHVVDDAHLDRPAVLLAEAGPGWRINRALFAGNRGGGGGDGAVVRALAGANVVLSNVTFDDNGFHPDIANGVGENIGVYGGVSTTTLLWLLHATMVRASPAPVPGSLLSIRGGASNVRLYNSALRGECALIGGTIVHAVGNIESPGHGCGMDPSTNGMDVPVLHLRLGTLADHGGFTDTYLPAFGSLLRDRATAVYCQMNPFDQRGQPRPVDGVDCDIGAVEANALQDAIFASGFD